jgi:hypothetical protein
MQDFIPKFLNEHSGHTGEDIIKIHVNVTWCQKSNSIHIWLGRGISGYIWLS